MVLYKRKPVPFPPPKPLPENLNVKCWYIPYTREWFLTYDDYLQRLDYYNTRKFVCEITGNSCLTFFEAYESEQKEMKIVEKNFPEHLKEPILRHLQFSTVPRIDQLVDDVYTTFKNDYYPGETVMIRLNDYKNDFKTRCIIREKAKFNAVVDANNNHRPAYCQYRVSRVDNGLEVVVDESQITRDRNNFTKWFVKTFIKLSVSRSPKIGAPWIVKSKYASKFRIPTELPPELAQFKEKPPTPKRKPPQTIRPKGENNAKPATGDKKSTPVQPGSKLRNIAPAPTNKPGRQANFKVKEATPPPKRTIEEDLSQPVESLTTRPKPQKITIIDDVIQEALESWTFLNVYRSPLMLDTFTFDDFITAMKWNNKNKQCTLLNEIFCAVLSAFITEKSTDLTITLPEDFDIEDIEIEENDESKIKIKGESEELKQNGDASHIESENGDSKDTNDVKEEVKDEKDNQEEVKEETQEDQEEEEESVEEENHDVEKYLEYRGISWQERLQKRNFKDGNWQIILLGVLDLVRDIKDYKSIINEIFGILAPLNSTVSPNAILSNFTFNLSINLRIKALNILCSLLVNSPIIRQFLDKCMSDSTELRRERLELLREYKSAFEKAQNTDKELRELVGAGNTNTTGNNGVGNGGNTPVAKDSEQNNTQPSESTETNPKKRRRRTGISKEPTEEELSIAKTNPKYATLLASRTAQLKISEDLRSQRKNLEKKIIELDVQRIRYLGKDRLFNRYWWFENNGLPNLGNGKSSGGSGDEENNEVEQDDDEDDEEDEDDEFLSETYLMGRLWVQGPTDEDGLMKFGLTKEKIQEWNDLFNPKPEEEKDDEDEDEDDDEDNKDDKKTEAKENGETKEETKDQDETQDEITEESSSTNSLPINFIESTEKLFQIKFESSNKNIKSIKDNRTLVDEYGAITRNLSSIERKLIEENPDPLLTTRHWRYYDTIDDVEKLIKWLNPWGDREVKLLKELNFVKDQINSSIKSRRKALKLDSKSQDEEQLVKTIEEIVISETEDESSSESESEGEEGETGSEADPEFLGMAEEEEQPRTRRSIAAAEKQAEERRRKEEEIRKRIEERKAKRERSKPSRRIAKREAKKRKIKEHQDKKQRKEELELKLENLQESNEIQRCLDWVNQSAIESLGHTHYEGPVKVVPRSKRSRR
ncbi:Imitation switch two complex protein 1 [Wickerhamomyces ciferrii]|uniref:Imitation switch two complex protein 1 n=1 Tax=Wickerhamomyces ciferrii (strain ATCC 14091 / BCRC 22168 / CBS 111 / JCM 3599 / NBRC 0793 / NRRL Y-1031 F-60-10) TaxID=1206466 RepID=K0KVY7_WICCF|nr:Imitation switch two complex protein 1 [Wickerhamomyces ciferrii]CCH45669.1 Imitation switch two complex protein 1 [Wickerhamomyces ciferrii]